MARCTPSAEPAPIAAPVTDNANANIQTRDMQAAAMTKIAASSDALLAEIGEMNRAVAKFR